MYQLKLNNFLNKILIFLALAISIDFLFFPVELRRPLLYKIIGPDYAINQLNAFSSNPKPILLHVILGFLFIFLMLIQLSRNIRERNAKIHKVSGYLFLLSANLLALTGVIVSLLYPFAGIIAVAPNLFFAFLIVFYSLAAISTAKKRLFIKHQIAVSRIIAISLGIVLSRLFLIFFINIFDIPEREAMAQAFWLGSGTLYFFNEFIFVEKLKKNR